LEQDLIRVILTKDQERSNRDKKRVRIGKSRCVELDGTYCCIRKFKMALSLCKVLGVAFYFSKSFLETAARESVAAKILQPLKVTIVYFLE